MNKLSIDFGFDGSIIVLLLCLAFSFFIAQFLYKKEQRIGAILKKIPFYRFLLIALRTLSIFILLILLLNPLVERTSIKYQAAKSIFLIDGSISMQDAFINNDSIDFESIYNILKENTSTQNIEYKFGKNLDSIDFKFDLNQTDIAHSIEKINEKYKNQNIAGVYLLSDGIHNQGKHPLYQDYNLDAPIITIGLGDTTPKKDIILKDVRHPDICYLNNDFEIKIDIESIEIEEPFVLNINRVENNKVQRIDNKLIDPKQSKDISIVISPLKEGLEEYQISIPLLKNESNVKNNNKTFFVEIIDGKQNILVTAARISPDIKAINAVIEKNENFSYDYIDFERLDNIDKPYDLIVLMAAGANPLKLKKLLQQINKQKIPTLFLIDNSKTLSNINAASRNGQYPNFNNITFDNASINDVRAKVNENFTPFQLSQNTVQTLHELPTIEGFSSLNMQLNSNQILLHQKIGKVNTNLPLLYFDFQQTPKLGVLLGSQIWKWRLADYSINGHQDASNELLWQTLQYLANKSDKRKFTAKTNKKIYNANEEILIKAKLYNENFDLITDEKIEFELINEKEEVFNFQFTPSQGEYNLNLEGFAEGKYKFKAACNNYSYAQYEGNFYINAYNLEKLNTIADHQLLRSIAAKNNGKYFSLKDWKTIVEYQSDMEKNKLAYKSIQKTPLIKFLWIYFILLVTLASEWIIRKLLGGY